MVGAGLAPALGWCGATAAEGGTRNLNNNGHIKEYTKVEITFLGQAGLFIETNHGSILCDPWFNPAYFASWFPFPSNEGIDLAKIEHPTYLYLSHQHHDHFDPQFLREHVSKDTTILLPDYPINLLERALRNVGFTKFIYTKNGQALDVDGLRFMIMAMVAPVDGPGREA